MIRYLSCIRDNTFLLTSVYSNSRSMNAPNRYELFVLDEGEKPYVAPVMPF